jgi:hypothetical protein
VVNVWMEKLVAFCSGWLLDPNLVYMLKSIDERIGFIFNKLV